MDSKTVFIVESFGNKGEKWGDATKKLVRRGIIASSGVLITFIVSLPLQAFSQPKDLEGWNKARWGMTDEDISKAFGEQVEPVPNSKKIRKLSASEKKELEAKAKKNKEKFETFHTNLWIKSAEIYGKPFEVYFKMNDKTNKLGVINFVSMEKPSKALFKFLEKKLTEEYGFPSRGYTSEGSVANLLIRNRFWIFPTTTIELELFDYQTS